LHDVIVIGGGPAGSYVARRLAEAGYNVQVLEKRGKVGEPVCCTGIISQNCFDNFNIDSNLILKKANSATVFSPSGKSIYLNRHKNEACIIDRAAFDLSMVKMAKTAGAGYAFNVAAEDIKQETNRVVVKTFGNGDKLEYETRVAVIASGFGSKLIGKVDEIKVEEGDQVKKGEVLLNLDHRELLIQKKQALAVLGYEPFFDVKLAAKLADCSESSIRRAIRDGNLKATKPDGKVRIYVRNLGRWLKKCG